MGQQAAQTPQTGKIKAKAAGSRASLRSSTSETDESYDLVSVLYHALKGAETSARFIDDARERGDEELITFFEDTRDEQNERAMEAKRLLATRLRGEVASGIERDLDEEEEDIEELDDEDDEIP